MSDEKNLAAEVAQLRQQHERIVRAVRFSLALILLAVAFACIRSALQIPAYRGILNDMMPDGNWPASTSWVIGNATLLLFTAVALPLTGLGMVLFHRDAARGVILASVTGVLMFSQWLLTTAALQAPLVQLMNMVGGNPP
jgi:hypothetical protein